MLRLLAAAEAKTGQYREAAAIAQGARQLAAQQGKRALADGLQANIARFKAGQPRRRPN